MKRESFEGGILEPCSGNGAISKMLEQYGYRVKSSDVEIDDCIYGEKGVDAFSIQKIHDNIVTNPPYSIATKLVEHFSKIYTKKMALLLKLTFLESIGRLDMFTTYPLRVIYIFSSRVTMYPAEEERPKNTGKEAYAWFVWEKGYVGVPSIRWISEKDPFKKIDDKEDLTDSDSDGNLKL